MRSTIGRSVLFAVLLAVLVGGVTGPPALAAPITDTRVAGINVDTKTIPQLQSLMNRHRLTSLQLVDFYLDRIRRLEPRLRTVIAVNQGARLEAASADVARQTGDRRPLLGIPIIVKDNIGTRGIATTGGSWALVGSMPNDAFIIRQLRRAGAIVIAKANLSEWANFRSSPSSSGWSGIGGQGNMAYVLDRNPCGSSSGTGVAVSADLATVGVGTETDGSIVCPSGANGIVGIKPTVGLLSRAGIIPISSEQDTAGPMTRNVTDAAVVLGAMTGIDPADPDTARQAGHAYQDYTRFLDPNALRGARIGVWREGTYDPEVSPEVHDVMNATVRALRAQGATVVNNTRIPIEPAYEPEFAALLCEFKSDIRTYLRTYTRSGYPKSLRALIDFNRAHPQLEGDWNNAIFRAAQATGGRAVPECTAARREARSTAREAINETLRMHDLDAIIGPTNGPAWVTDPVNGDLGGDFSTFVGSSSPSAIAGFASITVPAGFAGPLPIGVTFIGGRWDEPQLIGYAYAFEQATQVRVPPEFIPSIGADRLADPGSGGPAATSGWNPALLPLR